MSESKPGRPDFKLTWVHLSDIHFGAGGAHAAVERADVLGALIADLRVMTSRVPSIDQVVLSGDVAFSGGTLDAAEYAEANKFLHSLCGTLSLGSEAVLVVPGNHDVDRSVATSEDDVRRWLDELRTQGRPVDEAVAADRDRLRLGARMSKYLRFAQDFGQSLATGDIGLGFWTTLVEARDDLRVRISGGNTALLSQGDDDRGKLQLGLSQLQSLQLSSDEHDVLILVTHHPLDWLGDQATIEPRVRRLVDVHLYGHVHEADSERASRGGGGDIVRVVAGAVHEYDNRERHGTDNYGYSVCSLFRAPDGDLGLRVWPRIWNPRDADFRTDVRSVPDGQVFVDHSIPQHGERAQRRRARGRDGERADDPRDATERLLWRASERSARRLGARRTAYPLDLSIAELHARGVYVPAGFARYNADGAGLGIEGWPRVRVR
jgi:3',5'-cyclic AMP phosphodiesterase CpdA